MNYGPKVIKAGLRHTTWLASTGIRERYARHRKLDFKAQTRMWETLEAMCTPRNHRISSMTVPLLRNASGGVDKRTFGGV